MSTQDFEFKVLTDPYMVQPGQTGSSRSRTPNKSSLRCARKHVKQALDAEKAKALEKERGDQRAHSRHGQALCAALLAEVPKEFEKRPAGPEEVPKEFEKRPAGPEAVPQKSMPMWWKMKQKAAAQGIPEPPPPAKRATLLAPPPPPKRAKKVVVKSPRPPKKVVLKPPAEPQNHAAKANLPALASAQPQKHATAKKTFPPEPPKHATEAETFPPQPPKHAITAAWSCRLV